MPSKPATKKPAKPAAKPATPVGVTLKDVAAKLGKDPKAVRAAIRRMLGGAQVGKGGRYTWQSWKDPQLVGILKDLSSKTAA